MTSGSGIVVGMDGLCRTCHLSPLPGHHAYDCPNAVAFPEGCDLCGRPTFGYSLRFRRGRWHLHSTAHRCPKDWDVAVVLRLIRGDPPDRVRPCERREAARRLDRPGVSARAIAERLNITPRSVERYRLTYRKVTR